ncbi:CocE/NonD family hydrolase [Planotetraspora phitsanulokensis]|uniref:Peptidase S15 n=1 Tax=Planotetraspora phitsanulokensis TaxID=575192 RepID=A0A8J3U0Z7_9ACTN|nr:CocE/NonD family hydrolase [Planotetraspora phitsanulokensis]GII35897.1 peptidase S15 [Planotetraspora phitsanulokensis]
MHRHISEIRDGMRVEWDVPIPMPDGTVLRADVFRPVAEGRYPVIMTHGPYAKGLAFQQGYAGMWKPLSTKYPDAVAGSSNKYQNWETVDPEKWVPDGYVCIRVDSRGSGRSPGYLDIFSVQETHDYYTCVEWAGVQPWSNGKVGLLGISYYAMNQWQVAALRPPHLAAICPWEGAADHYREFTHHGGILNIFTSVWYPVQVGAVQHGVGERGARNPNTGEPVAGPETVPAEDLVALRGDPPAQLRAHPFDDTYYRQRSAALEQITVPVLSAANWAHALHTRGNFEAYSRVSSEQKWLEVHGLEHFAEFYTDYGVGLQKRFFGHFLKGADTGWDRQPPVQLNARHVDGSFELRSEQAWPLPDTTWTTLHLHPDGLALAERAPADGGRLDFAALGDGVTFTTEPFAEEVEITGPAAARLFVSSTTADADIFLTLRVLDPAGTDVTFVSGLDPAGVVAAGWLRASHRAVDPERSLPHRPWHPHDHADPLTPGEVVQLDVEIWPTSVVIPAGHRLACTVRGRDFEFPGDGPWPATYGVPMKGHGMFLHTDPHDRPEDRFGGTTTLVSDRARPSSLLLPFVPRTTRRRSAPRRRPGRA